MANRKKCSYRRLHKYVQVHWEIVRVLLAEMVCDKTVDAMEVISGMIGHKIIMI